MDAATGRTLPVRVRKEEPLAYIVKLQVGMALGMGEGHLKVNKSEIKNGSF